MLVLGIETSCDETALALVEDGRGVMGTQVASSLRQHQRYGGVVPEIASRAHVELLTVECESLLSAAHRDSSRIDRIAVTVGPGLSGSLMVGVAAAKALALAWRKEIIGINHLRAHLYAAVMENFPDSLDHPAIGLVISGGHTALVQMRGLTKVRLLGQTRDDAVGEAFDKVAKLLGLGFPGGPEIERRAREGNPKAFRFTVPRMKSGSPYDFSLSGIKTAVLHRVQQHQLKGNSLDPQFVSDLAASFQSAVVEEVVLKSVAACRAHRISHLRVGGGVVANNLPRERLETVCADLGIKVAVPSLGLCTDNGAMVAGLGFHLNPVNLSELRVIPDLQVELN